MACTTVSRAERAILFKAKAAGVYKGRPASIDAAGMRELNSGFAIPRSQAFFRL